MALCFNLITLVLLNRWFSSEYVYITFRKQPYMDTGNFKYLCKVYFKLTNVYLITEHEDSWENTCLCYLLLPLKPVFPCLSPYLDDGCQHPFVLLQNSTRRYPCYWTVALYATLSYSAVLTGLIPPASASTPLRAVLWIIFVTGCTSFLPERCPVPAVWTGTPTYFHNQLYKDCFFYLQRYRF